MKLKYELNQKDLERLIRDYYKTQNLTVKSIRFDVGTEYYDRMETQSRSVFRGVEIEFENEK